MGNSFISPLSVFLLLMISLTSCDGCKEARIPLPKEDNSAPGTRWVVKLDETGDQKEFTGINETWHIGKAQKITIWFFAKDNNGGIKRISRSGGGLTACRRSTRADIASVSCNDMNVFTPDASNTVLVEAFLFCSIDLKCTTIGGSIFPQVITGPGGSFTFQGEGENYVGLKQSSTLTITTDIQ